MAALQLSRPNTALVHDYMTQLGGAERLAGVIASSMPAARLLTSVHQPASVPSQFIGNRPWQTSFLQRFAGLVPLKTMLPVLPAAIKSLDVRDCHLVVSTSSAFAHHVRASAGATHVCYCSTPAHFLWNQTEYFRSRPVFARALRPLLHYLRALDLKAAAQVDVYLANSHHTAARIREVYKRNASVVYPPVDCEGFQPSRARSGRFLVVSRLVATKRVDLVVEAARQFDLQLDVIGQGPELARLKQIVNPNVRLLGWQPDQVVRRSMAESTAVIVAGEEDFGLVMAEAQASGRPPVAFGAGGAREIIEDGVTGFLFNEQTPAAIGEAMLRARAHELEVCDLRSSAARFGVDVFLRSLDEALDGAMQLSSPRPVGLLAPSISLAEG